MEDCCSTSVRCVWSDKLHLIGWKASRRRNLIVALVQVVGPLAVVIFQPCQCKNSCESHNIVSLYVHTHTHTQIIPYSRIFTEKLRVPQPIKNFCALCKNIRFMTCSKEHIACSVLTRVDWFHSLPSDFVKIHFPSVFYISIFHQNYE